MSERIGTAEIVYYLSIPCLVHEETKDTVILINHAGVLVECKRDQIKLIDGIFMINEYINE